MTNLNFKQKLRQILVVAITLMPALAAANPTACGGYLCLSQESGEYPEDECSEYREAFFAIKIYTPFYNDIATLAARAIFMITCPPVPNRGGGKPEYGWNQEEVATSNLSAEDQAFVDQMSNYVSGGNSQQISQGQLLNQISTFGETYSQSSGSGYGSGGGTQSSYGDAYILLAYILATYGMEESDPDA